MTTVRRRLRVALLLALTIAVAVFASACPRFSGSVSHRGTPLPSGVPVYAYVGTTVCGSATIQDGRYELWVSSAEQQPGCGYEGATVRFEVSAGPFAYQAGSYSWTASGDTILDLNAVYHSAANSYRGHARGAYDGKAVPNGIPVQAWVEGTLCGQTTISGGDGSYQLTVPSEGERAGCGYPTATVSFTVGSGPGTTYPAGSTNWPAGGGITTTFDLLVQSLRTVP